LKSRRAEFIEQSRKQLAEARSKYDLVMRGSNGQSLYEEAVKLKLTRKILSPPKTVIPCAAELKDIGKANPCLIVPSTIPIELLPPHKALAVGGQVLAISRTSLALSSYLMDESWRAQGFWNGQPLPIVVSIRGAYRYLVPQKSCFFRFEDFTGSDIDEVSPIQPDERDLKLGRYRAGADFADELTVVVAEY
jgi:hypothetical protein